MRIINAGSIGARSPRCLSRKSAGEKLEGCLLGEEDLALLRFVEGRKVML